MLIDRSNTSKQMLVDSLRLSNDEEAQLIERLEREAGDHGGENRRGAARLNCDGRVKVVVGLKHPGGNTGFYHVRPRDVSATGIGFLHGSFVYTQTPCVVVLIKPGNEVVSRDGQTVRCRCIHGHVHEVGVHFKTPVDPALFAVEGTVPLPSSDESIEPDPANAQAEASDGKSQDATLETARRHLRGLTGTILHADHCEESRKIVKRTLAHSEIRLVEARNARETFDLLRNVQVHLILADISLPDMRGAAFIEELASCKAGTPIVGLAEGHHRSAEAAARAIGSDTGLGKPLQYARLADVLCQYLI